MSVLNVYVGSNLIDQAKVMKKEANKYFYVLRIGLLDLQNLSLEIINDLKKNRYAVVLVTASKKVAVYGDVAPELLEIR